MPEKYVKVWVNLKESQYMKLKKLAEYYREKYGIEVKVQQLIRSAIDSYLKAMRVEGEENEQ